MTALSIQFRSLTEKVNKRSLRERFLVCLVVIFVILGLWDTLIYQSITLDQHKLTEELNRVEAQISLQSKLAEQILAKAAFDPNKETRDRLAEIKLPLTRIKTQIDSKAVDLITPQQMATALEELLRQHKDMVLISLETLPPTKLFKDDATKQSPQLTNKLPELLPVYRHGLAIEIEGGYFETLQYLKALETLKWRFYWERVDYQVQDYPRARIKISVYTLSFDEGWLGV